MSSVPHMILCLRSLGLDDDSIYYFIQNWIKPFLRFKKVIKDFDTELNDNVEHSWYRFSDIRTNYSAWDYILDVDYEDGSNLVNVDLRKNYNLVNEYDISRPRARKPTKPTIYGCNRNGNKKFDFYDFMTGKFKIGDDAKYRWSPAQRIHYNAQGWTLNLIVATPEHFKYIEFISGEWKVGNKDLHLSNDGEIRRVGMETDRTGIEDAFWRISKNIENHYEKDEFMIACWDDVRCKYHMITTNPTFTYTLPKDENSYGPNSNRSFKVEVSVIRDALCRGGVGYNVLFRNY